VSTPLLITKLDCPPSRPNLVARPHLIKKLNESLHLGYKLALIAAPAGFGKTTLVSKWMANLHLGAKEESRITNRVAWLSLDEGDNDPARFLTYLIAALQNVEQNIGQAAQMMMESPQPPPPETLLTSLINDLADSFQPLVLVFDDYHVIKNLDIHQQLGFLVEHKPTQMYMVLLTREDPPLPLSRLRARGQMVEIRQDDLRFSLDECGEYLQQVMDLELSPSNVAALERRTEGWIAGLQLAAFSMKGRTDIQDFVRAFTGSNRYILDYLIEEVFEQQSADVQDFLLKTSILERLSASICDAVSERTDSQDLLFELEKANLFVVPLDQSREWYRYHHLFAELLRHQLHTSGKYTESILHIRASQWFESNGYIIEAVQHALAAKDWDRAGRVIARAAMIAIRNGQLATVHSWLNALPDEHVRASLELAITKGWVSIMMGQFETAGLFAAHAESLLLVDTPFDIRAPLTALHASLAILQQDISNAIELSQETLKMLDDQDNPFIRSLVLNNLAQAHMMTGNLPAATAIFRQIVHLSDQSSHSPTTISALANLAALLHQGGKRREAILLCQQAIDQCVDTRGRPLPLAGYAHIPMGILCYEANDLEPARHHLLKGMEYGEQLGVATGVATSGGVALAQLQQVEGEAMAALSTIAEVLQLASQSNLGYVSMMAAGVEADILMKQGNIEAAARWAETAGLSPSDMPNPFREGEYTTYARLLLAQNRLEEADTLLANFEHFAREGGRHRSLITVYTLQALSQQAHRQSKQALTFLEKALLLAAPEGYRRAFLDEGQPLINLLPKVRHIAPDFVDQLFEDAQLEPGLRAPSPQIQPLVEPLSERELEILRLVADGLTNQQIAENLILSVGTIKAHLHNIYGKLEVRGRTQAIARARDVDLI
jgi:LuxR family maltose regulon positive regulatory protein